MSSHILLLEHLPWLICGLLIVYSCFFIVKLIRHRRFYAGLPTPPHSMLLGNLKVLGDTMKRYPADFHPQPMFADMAKEYGFRGLYYVDTYPFAEPLLIIVDPSVSAQVNSVPRHPFAIQFLRGLVGKKSIFSTTGAEWQAQRSWFSPAFSLASITALVPGMVEEALIFKEKLTKLAVSGETFSMNKAVIRLTFDVIARSGFDLRLGSQTNDNPIFTHFQGAVDWTAGMTDGIVKKLLSPIMMDWHTHKLDKLLRALIKERYALSSDDRGTKSISDLALRGYQKENGRLGKSGRPDLDDEFMQIALDNAKTFIIGGQDTTSALITYTYYLLSTHPSILKRVRQEHNEVFGNTIDATLNALAEDPHLLNKLPLTLAVFKEVLRLYPMGFIVKKGAPGSFVTFEGREYPLENHMICVLNSAIQRDEALFPSPSTFNPDRFLPSLDRSALEAWMPFAKGPNNCIGQQLALVEAKVVMVLTLRYFDFEAAYTKEGPSIEGWGGRAYQELNLNAKPKDGLPMRVGLRS